jgi:hypothetical protein
MYSYNKQIRQALRDNPDGLTVTQIVALVSAPNDTVNRQLRMMPDTYIDRWQKRGTQNYVSAVWCVVVPPEDCPKPNTPPKVRKR